MKYPLLDIHEQIPRSGLRQRINQSNTHLLCVFPPGFASSSLLSQIESNSDESESPFHMFDFRTLTGKRLEKKLSNPCPEDGRGVYLIRQKDYNEWTRDWVRARGVEVLGSDRLGYEPDEVRELLEHFYGNPVGHDIAIEIREVTGGWPLLIDFILESASSLDVLRELLHSRELSPKMVEFVQDDWKSLTGLELKQSMVFGVVRHLEADVLSHVSGTDGDAKSMLQSLTESGLLSQDAPPRLQHPLLRDALERVTMTRWPDMVKKKHLAAANYLKKHYAEERSPDIVAHYLEAGDVAAAGEHLDEYADTMLERVSYFRLHEWLSAIEHHNGELPIRSGSIFARVCAISGHWAKAREVLHSCDQRLKQQELTGEERTLGFARVASVKAHMAWLKGVSSEANTYCQRAVAALDQLGRTGGQAMVKRSLPLRLDLLELRATLALEAGQLLKARELLTEIARLAEDGARAGTKLNAMKDLAILAMREGLVVEAKSIYDMCESLLDRRNQSEIFAGVHANRARCFMMTGHFEDALESINHALSVRRLVSPESMANTLLATGQIYSLLDKPKESIQMYRKALSFADQTSNTALRARVRLWMCSQLAASSNDKIEIDRMLTEVSRFVGNIERSYPILAAVREMILGQLEENSENFTDAIGHFTKATHMFQKMRLPYYESLCHLKVALVQTARNQKGQINDSSRIRTFADKACAIANKHLFVFGLPNITLPILESAAGIGAIEASRYLSRINGVAYQYEEHKEDDPPLMEVDTSGFMITQEGVRYIDDAEIRSLKENINPQILNIIIVKGATEIIHRGKKQTGDLKRIIIPLLRKLLSNAGEEVKAPELAGAVWGGDIYDQKARTRLKVAISRLRTLLKEDGGLLTTLPGKGPNRAENTGYRIENDLEFLWIEG